MGVKNFEVADLPFLIFDMAESLVSAAVATLGIELPKLTRFPNYIGLIFPLGLDFGVEVSLVDQPAPFKRQVGAHPALMLSCICFRAGHTIHTTCML